MGVLVASTVAVVIAVCINLFLPQVLKRLATRKQIMPPHGRLHYLSFGNQLMHMFVQHAQVPITSSILVAVIMGLAMLMTHLLTTYGVL